MLNEFIEKLIDARTCRKLVRYAYKIVNLKDTRFFIYMQFFYNFIL